MYDQLTYDVDGAAAVITLNRPDALNALTNTMLVELKHAFAQAEQDSVVVGIVLTGAGRTKFGGDNWFTVNLGVGYRIFLTDWAAWRIEVRDHIFNRDIFGEDDSTNNIEFSSGVSIYF